jgi:hypothetical protein
MAVEVGDDGRSIPLASRVGGEVPTAAIDIISELLGIRPQRMQRVRRHRPALRGTHSRVRPHHHG